MKFTTKGVNLIKTIGYQLVIPVGGDNELSKISPDIEYEITIQKKEKQTKSKRLSILLGSMSKDSGRIK